MAALYRVRSPFDEIELPMTWQRVLLLVAAGKAAVAAAGVMLALLGAMDIAFASHAQDWYAHNVAVYTNELTALGGALGGIARLLFR